MDIQNKKIKEEFNPFSHKKLNLLVTKLINEYKEMTFLIDAQETIKVLEAALTTDISEPSLPLTNTLKNFPNNIFHTTQNSQVSLTENQSLLLYEKLLEQEIVIHNKDNILYSIIEKGIESIYNKKKGNLETELIQFLNIPMNILTFNIMQEFNNLIKYNPNKKDYNIHNVRFKLTKLCYVIGDLCINTYFKSHTNYEIRRLINGSDIENSKIYDKLIESFETNVELKTNIFFKTLFSIILKPQGTKKTNNNDILVNETLFEMDSDLFDLDTLEDFQDNMQTESPYVTNKVDVFINYAPNSKKYSYKIGQYFYKLIRTFLIIHKEKKTGVHIHLMKNKLLEYKIKIGSVFLHAFKNVGLFRENIVFTDNTHETVLFVPNINFFSNIISNIIHQRPYFVADTIKILWKKFENKKQHLNTKEFYIYNTCHTRYLSSIHKNPDIILKPTKKSKQKKLELFHGNHYIKNLEKYTSFIGTIDKEYYYNFLIMLEESLFLRKNNNKFTFEQNLERYSNIFFIYKIKTKHLLEMYRNSDLVHKQLLEHLFDFALDFNIQDHTKYVSEAIENLKPQTLNSYTWKIYQRSLKFFKDLYNKIFSYKIFLKGLLSECFIYCHFDFFIFDSFLDARGRHYLNGFYMNPQSYPLIKAFVKPYILTKDNITEKQFDMLKAALNNNPNIIESKEVSSFIEKDLPTYTSYKDQSESLRIFYMYSLFENPVLDLLDFKNMLISLKTEKLSYTQLFKKTLEYTKKYMINIKKLYVLHSTLLLYLKPRLKIINYFELDATASGLQMTALVLRDASLGELCNLTLPITNKQINKDLYLIFSQEAVFNIIQFFNDFSALKCSINLHQISYYLFDFFYTKKLQKRKKKDIVYAIRELKTILVSELSDKYYDILNLLTSYRWIIIKKYSKKQEKFISYIKKALNLKEKNDILYETLFNVIYLIGGHQKLKKLLYQNEEYSWFLNWLSTREVFKKAIMTFGYNATSYRRKEQFYNTLLEQNDNKKTKDLLYLVELVENLFMVLKDVYLQSAQILRDFGTIMSQSIKKAPQFGTSILINNGIFELELRCTEQGTSAVLVPGLFNNNLAWHTLNIRNFSYIKKKIKNSTENSREYYLTYNSSNTKALARKFAPNFIHSMDAWLICLFKYKIFHLNSMVGKDLFINNITNHDTFCITLAPILKYILMDIYKSLYFFDYLQTLNQNKSYDILLNLWYRKIILNTNIRKLNYRMEAYMGSPVTIYYKLPEDIFGFKIIFDMGSTTNLTLNPFFVK